MEEGLDWKVVLIICVTLLVALFIIMPAVTGGAGIEVPSIPGTGKQVCDLTVIVQGIWQHYNLPYWTDTVKIERVDYIVKNWRNVLLAVGTFSTADTGNAKIVWELYDDAGNKIRWGEQQFSLSAGWTAYFTIKGVEPGSYQLKVTVYQWWDSGLLGRGWDVRDSRTVPIVVNEPNGPQPVSSINGGG